MSKGCVFFLIIGLIAPFVLSKHVQFYRKDYTYDENYNAFYKVHWDASGFSWSSAFDTCNEEGARLFYPSGEEWTIIKKLADSMTAPPNTTEIYVGLHDEFNLGEFVTIDGKPTESPLNLEEPGGVAKKRCVMMDYVTGKFRIGDCIVRSRDYVVPYVCKKLEEKTCPTIDSEYKYVKKAKKCFKVNLIPKTWEDAIQTCYMEGGLLAVFENDDNVDWLGRTEEYYYVGVKKMFSSSDFYTVTGNKFDKNFFFVPNRNGYNDDTIQANADCGVIRPNNNVVKTEVSECNELRPSICEIAVE